MWYMVILLKEPLSFRDTHLTLADTMTLSLGFADRHRRVKKWSSPGRSWRLPQLVEKWGIHIWFSHNCVFLRYFTIKNFKVILTTSVEDGKQNWALSSQNIHELKMIKLWQVRFNPWMLSILLCVLTQQHIVTMSVTVAIGAAIAVQFAFIKAM